MSGMATSIIRKNVGWAEIFVQCLIEENKNEVMELNFFRNSGVQDL